MDLMNQEGCNWAKELPCGVTICDCDGTIIFMNDMSRGIFAKYGDNLIGRNLSEFHGTRALDMIHKMLSEGVSNSYTIEKNGAKKLIHQMPWFTDGVVSGLVELSIVIPFEMPNFVR